ncbi:hypothetical protein F5Y06DRAFT_285063 [Hypoxylon sp. FL0890]|nr:hypothetical protein F5Y06DRAFT_285063 [Hypoxylon sp. FL0890]
MNITPANTGNAADDAHLMRCWGIQNCKDCLTRETDCSWCPFSWTCVPNSNRVPFLAPAWDKNMCPHWAERWEVRTRPLGCQVSTITTLTSLVSIASTLAFVLLVTLAVWGIRKLRAYSKTNPDWWKVWRYDWRQFVLNWQRSLRIKAGMRSDVRARESRRERSPGQEPLLPS